MTKKIWKLNPEAIDFIIKVAPTAQKSIELLQKAHTVFNCDQRHATLVIAEIDRPFGPNATISLWRTESAELVEVPDDYEVPWDLIKKKCEAMPNDDKCVSVHIVVVGKGKASDSEKKDNE